MGAQAEARGGLRRGGAAAVISLPNIVSFARLLSVPLAVWLMLDDEMLLAFWVFMLAGLSDAVDGFIAKRFNLRTELGAYLDPLADKALLVSAYLTLGYLHHLPIWLVILVVFRDLTIIGGAIVVYAITGSFKSRPTLISKANTALQIALAVFVLSRLAFGFDDMGLTKPLVFVVAATTVLSGVAYLVHWLRKLSRLEDAR